MRDAIRARAVLGLLLLASITLVLLDVRGSGAVSGVRGLTAAVVGPVEQAVTALTAPFTAMSRSAMSFGDKAAREQEAANQLNSLASNPGVSTQVARQAAELEQVLKVAGVAGYQVIPARVVAYGSGQSFSGEVTIDAGSRDGLATDMSVVTGDGLVGRIVAVAPSTSVVQLITNGESVVGARMLDSGQAGALSGVGQAGQAVLRLLDPTAAIKEGDKVVSFGSPNARPYAGGLPLGTVTSIRGDAGQADREALITPAASMTALDVVGVVVVAPRTQPRTATASAQASPSLGATP